MGSFGLNYKLTNASNPLGEMEGTGANLTEGLKGWFLVRLWFCHRRRMVKPSHSFGVPQETHHHFRISLQVWGHAFHGFETVQPQMLDLVSHAHAASTKALLNCIGGEEKSVAREPRQCGTCYRCFRQDLAGFARLQSMAPDDGLRIPEGVTSANGISGKISGRSNLAANSIVVRGFLQISDLEISFKASEHNHRERAHGGTVPQDETIIRSRHHLAFGIEDHGNDTEPRADSLRGQIRGMSRVATEFAQC